MPNGADTQENGNGACTPASGVPLGGLGTGCVELGRDGRFRNLTINNNRDASTRLALAEEAFLAVRVAQRGRVMTRILQPDASVAFDEAGIVAPYTPVDTISWTGLYPCSRYHLSDPQFLADVSWRGTGPIVPFDVAASSLPLFLVTVDIRNLSDNPVDVSVALNWMNVCGCTGEHTPNERGSIRALALPRENGDGGGARGEIDELDAGHLQPDGLEYGTRGPFRTNAEGHYCVLARANEETDVSVMGWDAQSPGEVEIFWRAFHDDGRLGNVVSRSPKSHSGTVCCSFSLLGREHTSVGFVVAWYCPRFVVGGVDQGNYYVNDFGNAAAVAQRGRAFYSHYLRAIEAWQNLLVRSSLPRWLGRMLINSSSVLSTNSFFGKDGQFALFESPARPWIGSLRQRFYSSLGLLVLYPSIEERALGAWARPEAAEQNGFPRRHLGWLGAQGPGDPEGDIAESVELASELVLMAYRNYHLRGNLARLQAVFPSLTWYMAACLDALDAKAIRDDGGGLAGRASIEKVLLLGPRAAGLWLAALRGYVKLAEDVGDGAEAAVHGAVAEWLSSVFDDLFWNEEEGHYASGEVAEPSHQLAKPGCDSGQLAGQWYADFLCLGSLVGAEQIERVIGAIRRRNERAAGIADSPWCNVGSPPFLNVDFGCLAIHHRRADPGLYAVKQNYQSVHVRAGRPFDQPLQWNVAQDAGVSAGDERTGASLSVWHVLYALEGLFLDIPQRTLWLRPNLPLGVGNLHAPLFSPCCFGWLDFVEGEQGGVYTQRVRVTFDSPVHIARVVLRVPSHVGSVQVSSESGSGAARPKTIVSEDDGVSRVIVMYDAAVIVDRTALEVEVQGRASGSGVPRSET